MVAAAGLLAGPDRLRLDPEESAATLYVLYSPQVADMLIGDYGWSPERYEKWLARMILEAVLGGAKRDRPDQEGPHTHVIGERPAMSLLRQHAPLRRNDRSSCPGMGASTSPEGGPRAPRGIDRCLHLRRRWALARAGQGRKR